MSSSPFLRVAVATIVLASALAVAAPPASAVTYVSTYLLVRWEGEGCIGTATGTSISLVARDTWQASGTRTASWPGVTSATRCKGDSYGGLIQVGPVSLIKYDGYHVYRLEASITDATGTVTKYGANGAVRIGGSCTGSTYYLGTSDAYCSSSQPSTNYLGVVNQRPATPSISSLYPDYPDYAHSLYLYWSGPSYPSDFNQWEVHMSTTSGFTPSYSFPSTLKATRSWGFNYLSVTGLQPDTQYCFKIRNTDRYWKNSDFTTRNYPSYGESGERCARTASETLRVTSPNGGEIWSGTHAVTWLGGTSPFTASASSDGGAAYSTIASGVTARSTAWDTRGWPDGANYRVRVADASASDASDATFTVDNTPPETTHRIEGDTCNGWYTSILIHFDATDNLAGVRKTFARSGGVTTEATPGGYVPREGEGAVEYWSDDRADAPNVEATKSTGVLRVDLTDPRTTLDIGSPSWRSAAENRTYVNSSTLLTLVATDAGSGINRTEYRLDGGAWAPYGGPFVLTGPDGPRTLEYRSTDHACREESLHVENLFLDNTPPEVEIVEPAPPTNELPGDPAGLLALLESLGVELPETPALDAVCDVARILADGLRANGQPDLAALVESLLCGGAPAIVSGAVTVRANATDPLEGGGASGMRDVRFLVDGVERAVDENAPFEWEWNTTAEENGRHTLRVLAADRLAQESEDTLEVIVLNPPPGVDVCGLLDAVALPPEAEFARALAKYALETAGVPCPLAFPTLPQDPALPAP